MGIGEPGSSAVFTAVSTASLACSCQIKLLDGPLSCTTATVSISGPMSAEPVPTRESTSAGHRDKQSALPLLVPGL